METQQPNWEQRTIERIALEGIKEQRRSRRWRIFFKILLFVYLTVIIASLFIQAKQAPAYDIFGQKTTLLAGEHIALVRLNGLIAAGEPANAEGLNATLRKAMSDDKVKGVLLLANSPGGSPVQSSEVYKTIRALKKQYKKPILTAVSDSCASGCYYIAAATDEIYADESSIVGSIGVISQSFGYGEAAKKLGIDPRTFTAGENKDFMNPARPMTDKEIAFLKTLLEDLHQNFITAVKAGRGGRLANNAELFSGLFWVGEKAKNLGLIDGFATPLEVAKKIGDYPVYDYMSPDPLEKVLKKIGVEAENAVSGGLNQVLSQKNQLEFR
ncbi:MAG: signal peptide peptidase SppA [Gammaproteobacteria bacterium]|nr:MAG: signal peptide peptidase SppA [Gammaproteobacteria bacterium]